MRVPKNPLDLALIAAAIVSLLAIVLGDEDPTARTVVCTRIAPESMTGLCAVAKVLASNRPA